VAVGYGDRTTWNIAREQRMDRVRIYTEATNDGNTVNAARDSLGDFTVTYGIGVWHGKKESCMVFEVLHDVNVIGGRIDAFVLWLKENNSQEAVLMTVERDISVFLR
jgi:hypothetical protein